jgi:microcompartment protein CcmL/EutN
VEIRIIKSPSPGTIEILMRRKGSIRTEVPPVIDAVGLVQGRMIEMVVAADIAEKAVGVTVEDIKGSCPQNTILLAIFGDTASVEDALTQIKEEAEGGRYL